MRSTAAEASFPYDDAHFEQPATFYNHALAQSAPGLAVSAFRQPEENLSHKDRQVRAYLSAAGFSSLRSEEYDVSPSIRTLATMIDRKQLRSAAAQVSAMGL